MTIRRQVRHINDTLTAIAATLQRPDGTAVDLTGYTISFTMVDVEGNVKVTETTTGVTVTDAGAGEVQYDPAAADVDADGVFYGYFIAEDGTGLRETFPSEKGGFEIIIEPDA